MASGTFGSADILDSNFSALTARKLFMEPFEPVVKIIPGKLYFGLSMTINAPSHAEHLHLLDTVHGFYIAMT